MRRNFHVVTEHLSRIYSTTRKHSIEDHYLGLESMISMFKLHNHDRPILYTILDTLLS